MTTTQAEAAPSPESPATVPTLQDHAAKLAPLGWTGREAEWLALVALHSGVFTRSQWRHYFDDPRREMVSRFVRALVEKKLAFEDERPIFPGRARAVLLTGKPLYHALGIPDVTTPPVEGRDHRCPHPPAPLARLHYRAADVRLAPHRGRQGASVRDARTGPAHLPVPAVRPGGHTADPALFCVQAARSP